MRTAVKGFIKEAFKSVYDKELEDSMIQLQSTGKDFRGEITLVVFPLLKLSKNSPQETATNLGEYLRTNFSSIAYYEVIKGFLNLTFTTAFWRDIFTRITSEENFGFRAANPDADPILVEYSSPNTNKPLHLGHIRNNLLGFSLARILEKNGNRVIKTNIVNDRGIHICKSMVAWMMFGKGETPSETGEKGDHLVGRYYVMFEKEYRKQIDELKSGGMDDKQAASEAPVIKEAREVLRRWESGDDETIRLWKMMNDWVYEGFDETYRALGVNFDRIYYESDTYKIGKEIVNKALSRNQLVKKEDGSVWADLSDSGLDQKLLLRSDGTAVYMTQDLGTAVMRYEDYRFRRNIYVVGNEQNYHFQVLKGVLKKIGYNWSDVLFHYSYGMVELPEGKMKSREGKVVDADDLIDVMIGDAREMSVSLGKLKNTGDKKAEEIYRMIGLGALKYFILKVDPKKNMMFNPEESIDFNGHTGPFIQYTYARIQSLKRKYKKMGGGKASAFPEPNEKEAGLIKILQSFPELVREAGESLSPALIANYCYDLAREFNQYYHDFTILGEEDADVRAFRVKLSDFTGQLLQKGMWLLGIDLPDRM